MKIHLLSLVLKDGVLSNLGVNSVGKGEVAVTIGTSGAIRTVIDKPRTDYKGRIFLLCLNRRPLCHWWASK